MHNDVKTEKVNFRQYFLKTVLDSFKSDKGNTCFIDMKRFSKKLHVSIF